MVKRPSVSGAGADDGDRDARALYQARLMDHARAPRGRGPLPEATHHASVHNRLCGDHVTVALVLADQRVAAARFEGEGCALSMASASMLTDALAGVTTAAARALQARVVAALAAEPAGDDPAHDDLTDLGDLAALASVRVFPARRRCVTLAWEALAEALGAG